MKKPIDPNLNDNFDIDILETPKASPQHSPAFSEKPHEPEIKNTETDFDLSVKNPEASHHHHHHSSNGEQRHTSHSEHHHSSSHHSSRSKKKKKKKIPIAAKIAIIFLLIILFIIIAGVAVLVYLEYSGKSDLTNLPTDAQYDEVIEYNGNKYVYNDSVISIAFIGVDKRTLDTDSKIGAAGQADTDLLLTVDANTGESKVIAIPRDTMVDVDLYSESNIFLRTESMQLCLSYAYGDGGEASARNVTTSMSRILYNMPINKYFVLDLDGIAPINDAIGGVTVESLYDFNNLGIYKGDTIHLTGEMTEKYVRTRDMDSIDASLNRTARQMQYIKAFASQLVPAVVNDFGVISRLYSTASDYCLTDLELSNVTFLASKLLSKGITDFDTTMLQGEMVESETPDELGRTYAQFYPDEEATLQLVLDTFYTQID